jgi:hypothetical protein
LITFCVFDAVRWIGKDQIVFLKRDFQESLRIIDIGRLEIGIDVNRIAGQGVKIDSTRKDVENLAFFGEQ